MKTEFILWESNLIANEYKLTTAELEEKFDEWLDKKDTQWLEYAGSYQAVIFFITDKEGLKSTFDQSDLNIICQILRPKYKLAISGDTVTRMRNMKQLTLGSEHLWIKPDGDCITIGRSDTSVATVIKEEGKWTRKERQAALYLYESTMQNLELLKKAYITLLKLDNNTMRIFVQPSMCNLRDTIARCSGQTDQKVQEQFEELAAIEKHKEKMSVIDLHNFG